MGVVGFGVDAGLPNANATAVMLRGVIDEAFADGARIVPHHAAGLRIKCENIVGDGYQHQAVYNYRGYFHVA